MTFNIRKGCLLCPVGHKNPAWFTACDGGDYCKVHALRVNASMLRAGSTYGKLHLQAKADELDRLADSFLETQS